MVIETYYAGGYWGARQESLDLCTERVAALLVALGQCDLCLARWFMQGETREEALTREVTSDTASLRELLAQTEMPTMRSTGLAIVLGFGTVAMKGRKSAFLCTAVARIFGSPMCVCLISVSTIVRHSSACFKYQC